jgi:hypothetical protein
VAGILALLMLVALAALIRPVFRAEKAVPIAAADTTPEAAALEVALANDPAVSLPERAVYPYSIVEGGAHTVDELKRAIANDPVVAGHYRLFDLAKTRVEKLAKPKVAFVSYRMGNDIYWTRKPLVIRAGEKVLTDGANIARIRCANQLSTTPGPTSEFEPPAVTLDTPVLRPIPVPPFALSVPPVGVPVPPIGVPIPRTGVPVPPGPTSLTPPPIGSPVPTDTPVEPPPVDSPPPVDPSPPDPPAPPPPGNPPTPPPLPPITLDDPILPPPPSTPETPIDPEEPEDPEDPEDPPTDPPKDPPTEVPEPATATLLMIAAGACALGRRTKPAKAQD